MAATKTILGLAPTDIVKLSPIQRSLVTLLRPVLVRRYLAAYGRHRTIETKTLRYYEVASAMRALVRAAEDRTRPPAEGENALIESDFPERLANRVRQITRVEVGLPRRTS